MEILRHPANCEICRRKLEGGAAIEIEREMDDYFFRIEQVGKRDWGLCPRCKRIACHASCWDKERTYCVDCPSFASVGDCPQCRNALTGAVEVVNTETDGIPTIVMRETPDRNWIQCDICGYIVCKACCREPQSGYCDRCLTRNERKTSPCPVTVFASTATFSGKAVGTEGEIPDRKGIR